MVTINPLTNPLLSAYSSPKVSGQPVQTPTTIAPAVSVSLSAKVTALQSAVVKGSPPMPVVKQGVGMGALTLTISNYNAANTVHIYNAGVEMDLSNFTKRLINGNTMQYTLKQGNIVDASPLGVTTATATPQFTVQVNNAVGMSPLSGVMTNPLPVYDVTADINVAKYKLAVDNPTIIPNGFQPIPPIVDNGAALSRNFSTLLDMTQDFTSADPPGPPAAITGLRYVEMLRPTLTLSPTDILKGDALKIQSGNAVGKPYFYSVTSATTGLNPVSLMSTGEFTLSDAITLSPDTIKLMKGMTVKVEPDDLSAANAPQLAEKIAKLNALFATEGQLGAGQVSKFKLNIRAAAGDVQANIDVLGRLTRLNKISLVSNLDQSVALPPTTPFSITADQYRLNKNVLNAIGTNYQLHLSGVKAVDAITMQKDSHVLDFSVEDKLSNVLANAATLNKIPKNFTLAIKDTINNVVSYSSNLGSVTKPYTLNIIDASLDKVLQNSSVLGKLKVSYNLRDKTSEVIAHADDLVKFTKNVTIAQSLSNWENSSVSITSATVPAPTPAVSPFAIYMTPPAKAQMVKIVEGSAPVDQILVQPDGTFYSGLTIDKNNNIVQNGYIVGVVTKTGTGSQAVSNYILNTPTSGGALASSNGSMSGASFFWKPPSTFVPTDGKHTYQVVADPPIGSTDKTFGIKINDQMTSSSPDLSRSFTLSVISATVGGSTGLAQRYSSADTNFYMLHDSASALAHLDMSAASPFPALVNSGRLLGAISADGQPQASSGDPLQPPQLTVPLSLDADNNLRTLNLPVIGYDQVTVSNDGIVAKFNNSLTLNGVAWKDAPVLDQQPSVAEMVINSPISSIYNEATGVDNTQTLKSISKVLKINVQLESKKSDGTAIDSATIVNQLKQLYGITSVPGAIVNETDALTFPAPNPNLIINGIPIFQTYDSTTHQLVPYDAQNATPPIATVADLVTAINNGVQAFKDYMEYNEKGSDPSYLNIDLHAEIDSATHRLVLRSQTTPTISVKDPNNIMAYTGLTFGTITRVQDGTISLSGQPVASVPNGQASGNIAITVDGVTKSVFVSLGNNAQKNITAMIDAINKAFNYSSASSTYLLRATSDGTLNGGVKLSSASGNQITVSYPNDLTAALPLPFGSTSKYLQVTTTDASVLAPPDIQLALAGMTNNFVLNVIDTKANIATNQQAIDSAGRGQAKITYQN